MIEFCLAHNSISYNGKDWEYPDEDIEIILSREQRPSKMAKCSKCVSIEKRTEEFFKRR